MEVASVTGDIQVTNTAGEVISTVGPGAIATFGAASTASGASAGAPPLSLQARALIGVGVAASLAGLGLAVDAALQPTSTSP